MADIGIPGRVPGPAVADEGERPHRFGLTTAMALIVGSIIGVGIFNLPTSLAGYGPITLVSMALTTVGALVLALLFAALSRRLPADGGPYAYPRVVRDMVVAVVALVFPVLFIVYSRNTGNSFWVYWAPYFLAGGALVLGIPVYLARRRHLTLPGPVPAYR